MISPTGSAWYRRLVLGIALLLAITLTASASHHQPDEADPVIPESELEIHTHGRVFAGAGDLTGMFEYVARLEHEDQDFRFRSFTAGAYYRLIRNLKLGVFYRLQYGARHDDDWIEEGGVTWVWADTSSRPESVVILDATPRFLLDFLPGRNWVLSVKNRYEYNFFNGHQSVLVRPGLTWFYLQNREPVLNLSAQYASYFSLNFGDSPWYRLGPYFNLLVHVAPWMQMDASVSRQRVYWSESESFLTEYSGALYETNEYVPWIVDVGIIINLR